MQQLTATIQSTCLFRSKRMQATVITLYAGLPNRPRMAIQTRDHLPSPSIRMQRLHRNRQQIRQLQPARHPAILVLLSCQQSSLALLLYSLGWARVSASGVLVLLPQALQAMQVLRKKAKRQLPEPEQANG